MTVLLTLGLPLLLHVIHELLFMLIDNRGQLGFLVGRQDLQQFRCHPCSLYSVFSHCLGLLRSEFTAFRFIEAAAHHQPPQLLVVLRHLQQQRAKCRFFLGHDVFHLCLLRICEVQLAGKVGEHVPAKLWSSEHAVTPHVDAFHGLRYSDRGHHSQKQRNRQNLEIIRFHTSSARRLDSPQPSHLY